MCTLYITYAMCYGLRSVFYGLWYAYAMLCCIFGLYYTCMYVHVHYHLILASSTSIYFFLNDDMVHFNF